MPQGPFGPVFILVIPAGGAPIVLCACPDTCHGEFREPSGSGIRRFSRNESNLFGEGQILHFVQSLP